MTAAKQSGLPARPAATTQAEFITRDIAEGYVTGNCHNRTLMQGVVDKYARILRLGKWKTTHQGIAFDTNGTLVDGQHRLYAIWLVAQEDNDFKGVWVNVTRNLDPNTMDAIDIGVTRRPHDVILLANPEYAELGFGKYHVAIARAMAGGLAGRNKALRTIPEQEDFIAKHIDAIHFAQSLFPKAAKGVASAGLKAVLARAYYHLPQDTIRTFANVLSTGFYDLGQEAAIALRNALQNTAYSKNSDAACQLVYARTERALEAFAKARPLRKTPAPVQEELYPLAEEVSTAKALKEAERERKRAERAKASISGLKKKATQQENNVNRPLITNRGRMVSTARSTAMVGANGGRTVRVVKGGGKARTPATI